MAAGATRSEILAANRSGLRALRTKLLRKGINSAYLKSDGVLVPEGTNVEWAAYRLLRASNGECALYPRVKIKAGATVPPESPMEGNLGAKPGTTIYEGWDAFDRIEKIK